MAMGGCLERNIPVAGGASLKEGSTGAVLGLPWLISTWEATRTRVTMRARPSFILDFPEVFLKQDKGLWPCEVTKSVAKLISTYRICEDVGIVETVEERRESCSFIAHF